MVFSLSLIVVTTLVSQAVPPQTANGLRSSTELNVPRDPTKSLTPEMRGDILMARKMYREAVEKYRECPQSSAIIANKTGIAYHQMLDLDQAKRYYEKAVKLNPDYAEAINNLGTIFYSRKSYRRAISQYKKALRITPESASILSNLGTGYFARKNYDEAFKAYQEALRLYLLGKTGIPDGVVQLVTLSALLDDLHNRVRRCRGSSSGNPSTGATSSW
jgi:tetratricopeptide (TPR) repeat protein